MIKTLINENHNNWDELLPALEFAYNTSVHATTKMTPYFMMFGRHPKVPEDLIFDKPDIDFPVSDQEFVQQTKENLQQAFKFIKFNSDSKIDLAKIQYNRNHISCKFEIGDTVWARDFKPADGACKKFSNKWRGPYEVINRLDNLVYSLKPLKPKGRKITMHRNNLKRHVKRELATEIPTEIEDLSTKHKTVKLGHATPGRQDQENHKKPRGRPRKTTTPANSNHHLPSQTPVPPRSLPLPHRHRKAPSPSNNQNAENPPPKRRGRPPKVPTAKTSINKIKRIRDRLRNLRPAPPPTRKNLPRKVKKN